MAMAGNYRVVSEGQTEKVVIDFEMDADCNVVVTHVFSDFVPAHEAEKMRAASVPPHTYLYRVFCDGPVSGELRIGTFPGVDIRDISPGRYDELFAAMVNFLDNHSFVLVFGKDDLDEFIDGNCPR